MARPPSDLDDYLDWQRLVEGQKTSGLSVDEFCAREGLTRSSFYRWVRRLRDGIPDSVAAEERPPAPAEVVRPNFLPVSLQAPAVEIELPNGGVIRLPVGVGQAVLLEVIRVVGTLRPGRENS
jgi:transposase-like protein